MNAGCGAVRGSISVQEVQRGTGVHPAPSTVETGGETQHRQKLATDAIDDTALSMALCKCPRRLVRPIMRSVLRIYIEYLATFRRIMHLVPRLDLGASDGCLLNTNGNAENALLKNAT